MLEECDDVVVAQRLQPEHFDRAGGGDEFQRLSIAVAEPIGLAAREPETRAAQVIQVFTDMLQWRMAAAAHCAALIEPVNEDDPVAGELIMLHQPEVACLYI